MVSKKFLLLLNANLYVLNVCLKLEFNSYLYFQVYGPSKSPPNPLIMMVVRSFSAVGYKIFILSPT